MKKIITAVIIILAATGIGFGGSLRMVNPKVMEIRLRSKLKSVLIVHYLWCGIKKVDSLFSRIS